MRPLMPTGMLSTVDAHMLAAVATNAVPVPANNVQPAPARTASLPTQTNGVRHTASNQELNRILNGTTPSPPPASEQNSKPTIRFTQHVDSRAPRPSLQFSPMGRTLPTGKEVIKVGRYSERETAPNQPANLSTAAPVGFKSKVVSRRHCEFWVENGQWYIKDVKSSSGTFLNHVRLSSPNTESKPFPIRDGDIVQLGIDFKGGEEMIFRCVKIRVEINRGWQAGLNQFNVATHKRLRNMVKSGSQDDAGNSSNDCTICLAPVAPCQSLFVAPCSHTWHFKCVRRIIQGPSYPHFMCPNCRAVADLEAEVEEPTESEWEELDAAVAQSSANAAPLTQTQPPQATQADQAGLIAQQAQAQAEAEAAAAQHRRDNTQTQTQTEEHDGDLDMDALIDFNADHSHDPSQAAGQSAGSPMETDIPSSPALVHPQPQFTFIPPLAPSRPIDMPARNGGRGTPSPDAMQVDVLGPMTPRNDDGPFIFDGRGSRDLGTREDWRRGV